jgi:hypothetical protein
MVKKLGLHTLILHDDPLNLIVSLQRQFAKLFWEFVNRRAAGGRARRANTSKV